MTKDQASDLKSLISRVVEAEKITLSCQFGLDDAKKKLENFLFDLQDKQSINQK